MLISIIVPCYNEYSSLPYFREEILKVMELIEGYEFECIFVDDGSKDKTLDLLKEYHEKNEVFQYISFARNFGKESAIYAGLKYANGDLVVIMDADLQDPPSLLQEMITYIEDGYDSVATRRVSRKGEPLIRSFFARMFYKIMNKISDCDIVDGARDFRLMTRKMVNVILSMNEVNRFSKGIFGWIGFKTKWIEYENVERVAGETKWSFWKLFKYSLEGIVAFSVIPLQVASLLGLFISLVSFIFIIIIVTRTMIYGDPVSGWPSTICIIMMMGGIQLLCIGILGQYMSKVYLETKNRPIFIEKESSIDDI